MTDIIPQPVDADMLSRKIRNWDEALTMSNGRSLEHASITEGDLRVLRGGSVRISRGGTLEIIDGDLILGTGIIDGNALKDQLEPTSFYVKDKKTGYTGTTSFTALDTQTFAVPKWTNSAIIQATITMTATSTATEGDLAAGIRINNQIMLTCDGGFGYVSSSSDFGYSALLPYVGKHPVTPGSTLSMDACVKCRKNNVLRASQSILSFTGLIIWTR